MRSAPERPIADSRARQEANRAAFFAVRSLRLLRGVFWFYAALNALLLAAVLLGGQGGLLLRLIPGVLCLLGVLGALLVEQQPMGWTALNAALGTAALGFVLLTAGGSLLVACLLLHALTGWGAFLMARSHVALQRAHPELWAFRRTSGGEQGRLAQSARAEAARQRRRALLVAGGVGAALAALLWFASTRDRSAPSTEDAPAPPSVPFGEAEARFRAAWNASKVDEVKALIAPSELPQQGPFLDRMLAKRGWTTLPALPAPQTMDHGRSRWSATYAVPGLQRPLQVYFEWEQVRWVIVNWTFPRE